MVYHHTGNFLISSLANSKQERWKLDIIPFLWKKNTNKQTKSQKKKKKTAKPRAKERFGRNKEHPVSMSWQGISRGMCIWLLRALILGTIYNL